MRDLPAYAATPAGRALLAAIRIEQPDHWIVRRDATNARSAKFKGLNARSLRQMWERAVDAAMEAHDYEAFHRLHTEDHPDTLIERMLNEETVPFTPMEIKDLGGGTHRVAA